MRCVGQLEFETRLLGFMFALSDSPYLVGDQPTLAVAVAGLSLLIKFPDGPYLNLPATLKLYPGLADSVRFVRAVLRLARSTFYAQYRKPLTNSSTTTAPTSIQID